MASSKKLEAQWGDPVKSNLWKVEYDKAFTQYTIKSPVLEGHFVVKMYPPSSAEIKFFDATRGVTWERYLSPVTIEDILSRQFYLERIKPAIYLTHEVRLKKGLKVASSEIKLQWGDPPKPNAWKVKERPGRGVKYRGYIFDISTPLDPNLKIMIHQSPSMGAGKAYRTTAYYGVNFKKNVASFTVPEGAHPSDIFSTHNFWSRIIKKLRYHNIFNSIKVASSEIKLQWGDPPKPNVWKVKERPGRGVKYRGYIFDISTPLDPNLKITIHQSPSLGIRKVYRTTVFYGSTCLIENAAGFLVFEGTHPADIFSTQYFWDRIKDEIKDKTPTSMKVASSNLQAQWGDPPKPNMWKVETLQRSKMVALTRVTSPVLQGSIWLGVYGVVFYCPHDKMPSPLTEEKMVEFENNITEGDQVGITKIMGINPKRLFLSNKFYLEHLAPKIADGIIRLNGNVKVASGEALKAMWGDPPKPNVWSVEEVRYGWEPMYRVFSPLMEGEVWLSDSLLVYYFPKGLGLPQRKLGPDCDLRSIKLIDSNYPLQRLKSAKSKEQFLSQAFWLEHLKSNLNLKTSKLASKRGIK